MRVGQSRTGFRTAEKSYRTDPSRREQGLGNAHLIHLGHLALSGAALLTIEATAVLPEGRITYADVGLWSDETETAIARTMETIRRYSDIPIAIQLAHAGRKASTAKSRFEEKVPV
jgi:2,4-dienoyl-CoA reductase-like NADH-dependent reductase (Old Yellow Enzyme family)